jgi:hypothetical protein
MLRDLVQLVGKMALAAPPLYLFKAILHGARHRVVGGPALASVRLRFLLCDLRDLRARPHFFSDVRKAVALEQFENAVMIAVGRARDTIRSNSLRRHHHILYLSLYEAFS